MDEVVRPLSDVPAINRFLSYCRVRTIPAKSVMIHAGDLPDVMYYIVDGSVEVMIEDEDGNEMVLAYLNKGQFFGEMGRNRVIEHGGAVGKLLRLFHSGGNDLGVRMANRDADIHAQKVSVLAPLDIPQVLHRTLPKHHDFTSPLRPGSRAPACAAPGLRGASPQRG